MNRILFLFFIYNVCECCVIPQKYPISGRPSRVRRQVSLTDRADCGPNDSPPPNRVDTTEKVDRIISLLQRDNAAATIIPTADAHQSEYVSPIDGRREFISGFTGSAGTAVILADGRRALWTDGRYFLQGEHQLDCRWLLMREGVEGVPTIAEWLKESLEPRSVVASDARLISSGEWLNYEKELAESQIEMRASRENYVDEAFGQIQTTFVEKPLIILEQKFAGKTWQEKVADVRAEMQKQGAEMIILSHLDEVAWLLNLRGGDIPDTPVFKSYVIIDDTNVKLFIKKNVTPELDNYLRINQCDEECVEIHDYDNILETAAALSSRSTINKVLLSSKVAYSGGASYALYSAIPEDKRVMAESPLVKMKARKNPIEYEGMKNAHRKDAIALIDFLSLLEEEIAQGNDWNELSASERLREFRAEQPDFDGLSFEAISAFGPNGAVIHYRPTNTTNAKITDQSLYLLDSGGQYKDGTTDVTRTMHYGTPTDFQIEAYTRVLQGAINLAMVSFPKNTKDTRVDVLARESLYSVGLDYQHGTGHGIGMFLNIHESPTQVRIYGEEEHILEEGYFFSDEPGYYKDGEFGIRLETIIAVKKKEPKYEPFVEMFEFEAITLVPFEPKLIDYSILTYQQCEYLNKYHKTVQDTMEPLLTEQGRTRALAWMEARTKEVNCGEAPPVAGNLTGAGHVAAIKAVLILLPLLLLRL